MKYYYDCPLKAAYMAKYFGMEFEVSDYHSDNKKRVNDIEELALYCGASVISIHSDSLHILIPQVGDMDAEGYIYKVLTHSSDGPAYYWKKCDATYEFKKKSQTIVRNGTPFHWPEVEE